MDPHSPVRNRFLPSVDALEDRSLPSVTVGFTGPGALLVRAANNQAHTVSIVDNNGTVTVTADGVAFGSLRGITSIDYEGGNRGDQVLYVLQRSGSSGPVTGRHNLVADLKSGRDVFTGVIEGSLGSSSGSQRAQVNLRVSGATGGDTANLIDVGGIRPRSSLVYTATARVLNAVLTNGTISGFAGLNLNGTHNGSRGASVNATVTDTLGSSGALLIAVANGNGRNTDNVTVAGQVNGFLSVAVSGGTKRDVLTTNLNLAPGSKGRVVAQENGVHNHPGNGNDTLTLAVRRSPGDTPAIVALLDGGGSTGNCFNTANVIAFDFRTDTFIS
jgi:hypothetical protein